MQIIVFHQIGDVFSHYSFGYFFCSLSSPSGRCSLAAQNLGTQALPPEWLLPAPELGGCTLTSKARASAVSEFPQVLWNKGFF